MVSQRLLVKVKEHRKTNLKNKRKTLRKVATLDKIQNTQRKRMTIVTRKNNVIPALVVTSMTLKSIIEKFSLEYNNNLNQQLSQNPLHQIFPTKRST